MNQLCEFEHLAMDHACCAASDDRRCRARVSKTKRRDQVPHLHRSVRPSHRPATLRRPPGFAFVEFCERVETLVGKKVDVVTERSLSPTIREKVLAQAVTL